MSRRPARCTQADLNRALSAAEKRGPAWCVEALPDGTIRLVRQQSEPEKPIETPAVAEERMIML